MQLQFCEQCGKQLTHRDPQSRRWKVEDCLRCRRRAKTRTAQRRRGIRDSGRIPLALLSPVFQGRARGKGDGD